MKKNLVIFARPFGLNTNIMKKLKKYFFIKVYKSKNRPNAQQILKYAKNAHAIIAGGEEYNESILKKLYKLKIISRVGIGIDSIDIKYAKKQNIQICNTPDAPSNSAAEFSFSLIILALKKINLLQQYVKNKKWQRLFHHEFSKVSIGIIGYGRIGFKVVKLLKKIGFKKIFINEIDKKKIKKKNSKVEFVNKKKLFNNSDVVSLHVPLTKYTKNMINSKTLKEFKPGSILVNASRGGVVNIKDLMTFVKSKRISSAMLDVMPKEPYFGKLLNYKEFLITPHNASMSFDSRLKMEIGSAQNLINWIKKNK